MLSDLYPLLRTVQPAQLNYTLTALANALEGRGERLGNNFVVLDDYLKRMNPKIPLFIDDLGKLASVSDTYADVTPELANILRNSVTTGDTFVEKEAKVKALFDDVAGFSNTTQDFLEQNGQNIITLSKQGQRQLPVFAKYSPEYPCLLNGIVGAIPLEEQAFRGFMLHINLEVLPKQPRGYNPSDSPVYGEHGQNAVPLGQCEKAIHFGYGQKNLPPTSLVPNIKDGVNYGNHWARTATGTGFDVTSGYAGTAAERDVISSLRRSRHGRAAQAGAGHDVPALRAAGARKPGERAMKMLDKETAGDAIKLVIFIVVTTLATGLLVITIGNISFASSKEYKAVFTDATGVVKGDDVRVAGVKVGTVKKIDVYNRTRALVTFKVDDAQAVTDSTLAQIRYRNLVGQRYISLSQGVGGPDALKEGSTIPISRTQPALDLTVLFNGFKPLFAGTLARRRQPAVLRDRQGLPG